MSLRRLAPALTAGVVLAVLATPAAAHAAPDQELPFRCAEDWTGTTRAKHSPSPKAVDFNRPSDLGRLVVASAPGVVSRVENTGSRSYGKWVRIEHGDGHATLYAHLLVQWVVPGQFVDQGTPIGRVGSTGGSTGPHLHYEQILARTVVTPMFGQQAFVFGSTVVSQNCPDLPLAGDWNGDRADEVAVFRRDAGPGTFEMYAQDAAPTVVRLGRGTDMPVTGDWDGDGVTDVGVRRQPTRMFLLRRGDGTVTRVRMGVSKDVPVAGDWNGDRLTDVGIWRPKAGRFRLLRPDGTHQVVALGTRGSQPLTGDWNGDGVTDLGVYDAAAATFTLRSVAADGQVSLGTVTLGGAGDLPVSGDWNGDGVTDVGVWSTSTATYTLRVTPEVQGARQATGEPELRTLTFGRPR